MADLRFNPCPACGGDTGWEEDVGGYCRQTGTPLTEWVKCEECGGEGSVEVDLAAVSPDEDETCECGLSRVHPDDVDPPHQVRNPNCPVHGRDPDRMREEREDA